MEQNPPGKGCFTAAKKWNAIDFKSQITGLVNTENCCSKQSHHVAEHACVYVHVDLQYMCARTFRQPYSLRVQIR